MYKENKDVFDIAIAIDFCEGYVSKYISELIRRGLLEKRPKKRTSGWKKDMSYLEKNGPREPKPLPQRQRFLMPQDEDKKPTIGVYCDRQRSRSCVYGPWSGYNLCDYILVEKKSRPCPWWDCTCYQKIDKDHPRLVKSDFGGEI